MIVTSNEILEVKVAIVDLHRRFVEWRESEPADPEMRRAFGLDDGRLGWPELLQKRRVVVLAEAGSGKSTEFESRASLMERSHLYVFHATVEDVSKDGLDGALSIDARERLEAWKKSVDDGWFFIDSIDEAKLVGIKFETVVRKIADGIHGAEERCHIFLSGRVTDWEPQRDFETLKKWLRVSSVISKPMPTPEEELLRIIRNQKKPDDTPPPDERPLVAIMTNLDRDRVRQFAESSGIPDVEAFLKAIDDGDLWHFARRPMDLQWLVRFWRAERRLGTLMEMVDRSISEWLKETNPDRARVSDLDETSALHACERIGAAMVFGRRATIAIPDREVSLSSDFSFDLADVLPDWSGDDRIELLSRPIFDAATLGRVRLHNDNDGMVRSFLTARWLIRLRAVNLSIGKLFRLLFANSYGLEVIRPSLNETTAWLCLWDRDVANEVIRRAPLLLLVAGNPVSLPLEIRSRALAASLRELSVANQEWSLWDNDKLRRFAQSDLGGTVLALWPQYQMHREASLLLMRLVWLGSLKECEGLARSVAFEIDAEPLLRTFAGRALLAVGSSSTLSDYASLVKSNLTKLPAKLVRDAVVEFVPGLIPVSEVLPILPIWSAEDERSGLDIKRDGVALAQNLKTTADLELFLRGLLGQLNTKLESHSHHPPSKEEELWFPAMAASALRLLKGVHGDSAPPVAIDALLRICNRRGHYSEFNQSTKDALTELHRTGERRRQAFWHVVSAIRTALPNLSGITHWQMQFVGYRLDLRTEDVQWLLKDGLARGEGDCRLAIETALVIYAATGKDPSLLVDIAHAAESDPVAEQTFRGWTTPPVRSQTELDSERELKEIEEQNNVERDNRDQSWLKFIQDIQSDSDRIAKLRLPIQNDKRSDLMDLWQLLHNAVGSSHYAIDSVEPLERIAGPDVAKAVEDGLIAHWRTNATVIRSRRDAKSRNTVRWVDLMALTGVTLEATRDPSWATKLSSDEVRGATAIATIEINGFPRWLTDLAEAHPSEIRTVLYEGVRRELTRTEESILETLQDVAYANDDENLAAVLAPALLQDMESGLSIPPNAVSPVLQILLNGLPESERPRFCRFCLNSFKRRAAVETSAQYLAAVFSVDPPLATDVLIRSAETDGKPNSKLVNRFLNACFGDAMSGHRLKSVITPSDDVIEQLMLLSFRISKRSPAAKRPSGVYAINDDTNEEWTQSAIFGRFVKTPGPHTYQALRRLQNDPTFPVVPKRLNALAEERAVDDSESEAWPPGEAYAFEQSAETLPYTDKDLRLVVLGRVEDIQHDLLHADFSQAQTFKTLKPEREVQKWVADRLQLKQGRSYSVEREPHVINEKMPDVRIRSTATDANVSIEIKVAEAWTLSELDDALEIQLCGQYLRSNSGKYGTLLLVHQNARPIGWEDKANGTVLTFAEVVARLRARALEISGESYVAPQPEVAVLDVSTC